MPHSSGHVIVSKAVAFAKKNKYSVFACVVAFVAGALFF